MRRNKAKRNETRYACTITITIQISPTVQLSLRVTDPASRLSPQRVMISAHPSSFRIPGRTDRKIGAGSTSATQRNAYGEVRASPRQSLAARTKTAAPGDETPPSGVRESCPFPAPSAPAQDGCSPRPNLVSPKAERAADSLPLRREVVAPEPPSTGGMEREPGDSSLFFRRLQSRSHKKVKLRKRKSVLYVRPEKSSGRRGSE